jgi:hypothetical protein
MSDRITRYRCDLSNDGGIDDYADMIPCDYGSYASVDELRLRLEKAIADSCHDGDTDAFKTVLEWLGKE